MISKKVACTLMALTLLGLSGCNKRTIVLHPSETAAPKERVPVVKQPGVREEILIKKNPNLGEQIAVPKNNPSLGEEIGTNSENSENTENNETNLVAPSVLNNGLMERIDFPTEEYAHIKKYGRSTVTGLVYLENSHNSQKVMGEKVKLYLNPITSYSRQWYEESYLGGYKLSKSDSRLFNYLKFTVSDVNGKFNFFGVPRGDYYIVGTISCAEECGYSGAQTVRLVEEVSVGSGVTRLNLMKNVP